LKEVRTNDALKPCSLTIPSLIKTISRSSYRRRSQI
jgi:hypothetical protein